MSDIQWQSGIYALFIVKQKVFLIGSTRQSFRSRYIENVEALRRGKHKNSEFQKQYDAAGPNPELVMRVLEVAPNDCRAREAYWRQQFIDLEKRQQENNQLGTFRLVNKIKPRGGRPYTGAANISVIRNGDKFYTVAGDRPRNGFTLVRSGLTQSEADQLIHQLRISEGQHPDEYPITMANVAALGS